MKPPMSSVTLSTQGIELFSRCSCFWQSALKNLLLVLQWERAWPWTQTRERYKERIRMELPLELPDRQGWSQEQAHPQAQHCAIPARPDSTFLTMNHSSVFTLILLNEPSSFQSLTGITITDLFLKRVYEFSNLINVFVLDDQKNPPKLSQLVEG